MKDAFAPCCVPCFNLCQCLFLQKYWCLHFTLYNSGCQTITTNDWLGALDLATEWKLVEVSDQYFDKLSIHAVQVRNRAINALDSWVETHPAKKVVLLAKKYSISSWLKRAYLRLVQKKMLTTQELRSAPSLDWETIGRLFGVKDTRKSTKCSSMFCDDKCQGCHDTFPTIIENELS